MKLHKNLLEGLALLLSKVFFEKISAEITLSKTFKKNKKWGSKDRAFIAENFYEIIRHKRFIEYKGNFKLKKENIYQLIGTYLTLKDFEFEKVNYFLNLDLEKIKENEDLNNIEPKFRYSIADWLYKLGENQLGKEIWEKEICSTNQKAPLVIRVNLLKTTKEKLQKNLQKEGIFSLFLKKYPDGLLIKKRVNLLATESFSEGLFEIQDASSQEVSTFLRAQKGMHIIDACAGAGGKSLHLASIFENEVKITALDISKKKLKELEKRKNRAGAHCIKIQLIEENILLEKFYESAHRLLLDVPCSKLGVLKRHPDIKWHLNAKSLKEIIKLQEKILNSYAKFLKIGGQMLYATCSILPMENQDQIENFLNLNPSFRLISQKTIYSYQSGFDGFFMALIEKIR